MTVTQTQTLEPRKGRAMAMLARLGPFIGLAFVLGFFSIMRPATFPTVGTMTFILVHATVVSTAALGATMVIISGGIDLAVASNIAFCTVISALVVRSSHSPVLTAVVAVAASTCVGLLTGTLITGLKLAPFIVTLGMWGGVRGAAKYFADDATVYVHNADLHYWLNDLLWRPKHPWMLLPTGVWIMVLLCIITAAVLRYTRFGRHIFAIGSNEQTARLCGVPVNRTKIMIYGLAGLLAGIAGLMQFSDLSQGDPTTANGMELDIIAAVVIGGASLSGGRGTVLGTIVGSLIMKSVDNGCSQMLVKNSVEQMITGAIIIIACTLDHFRQDRD